MGDTSMIRSPTNTPALPGGLPFDATQLSFSQSPVASAGSVAAKLQQIISVKDAPYNAVGDGVTDDSAAIQAALTACAALGADLLIPVPNPYHTYYMGSTGITQSGGVRVYGGGGLEWSAAFFAAGGTAWKITGNYSILEHILFWGPKSVAAPSASVIGIDIQGPLNIIRNVRMDQTSAGNNSPWYTGVKINGISNTLEGCHIYAYDKGALTYGAGSRNDDTFIDCEITAQITAVIHAPNTGNLSVIGCDIEGACLYGIWQEASGAEVAGGCHEGNYIAGMTGSGIWINGAIGNTAKGVSIKGNVILCGGATNGVKATYTQGLVCVGNYITGLTNWMNLDTSNLRYQITPNYTSGALASSGTTTPAVSTREDGVLTLTLNAYTIVNGTGGVTVAGKYSRNGGKVDVWIVISTTGTATIQSVANTSNISGLPYQIDTYSVASIIDNTVVNLGTALFNSGTKVLYTDAWAANANEIIISGSYYTSDVGTND